MKVRAANAPPSISRSFTLVFYLSIPAVSDAEYCVFTDFIGSVLTGWCSMQILFITRSDENEMEKF